MGRKKRQKVPAPSAADPGGQNASSSSTATASTAVQEVPSAASTGAGGEGLPPSPEVAGSRESPEPPIGLATREDPGEEVPEVG